MLSFPLAASDLYEDLPIKNLLFDLDRNVTFSEPEDGERIPHARGARLWFGELELDISTYAEAAAVSARLNLIKEAGGSFMLYDGRANGPLLDPGGAALAGYSPQIETIHANMQQIDIEQLPPDYTLSTGDYLGFEYGSDPTRHALHQVAGPAREADALGKITGLQVVPRIRPGATAGAALTLVQPVCKAHLVESEYGRGGSVISQGGTLRWKQTLR